MEKFEANNGIDVTIKKLFILLPSSLYLPPDLKEISNDWMESAGVNKSITKKLIKNNFWNIKIFFFFKNLETIILDRSGVKSRTYHKTVYRLRTKGPEIINAKYIYLAVEGASPLQTFFESQQKSHKYARKF